MVRLFALGLVAVVAADTPPTLASCGADTDHFKVTSITTDADATGGPRKGVPFTVTIEGEMDEVHQHGTITGDLNIQALGIVTEEVKFNQKYDFFPGLAKGASKVVIGPFTFPRAVPGEVLVTGPITLVNEKAEPVTCLDLNLNIPKILSWSEMLPSFLGVGKQNCGDPTQDHITNIVSHEDNTTKIITTTMDLDEDLDYINLNVDLSFKVPVVPAVGLTLPQLPISLSPAIPAGQLKFVGYPSESESDLRDALVVTGTLKLEDENGDEVTCVEFDGDSSAPVEASSGTLALTFTDCGDASTHGTVKDIEPKTLTLGVTTDLTGTGTLDEDVTDGAFVMQVNAAGLIKQTLNGDICTSSSFDIKALGITVGTIVWKGMSCPVASGDVTVPLSTKLAASLPAALVHTTIALTATATAGDKLLCANIDLDKTGSVMV